MASNTTKQSMTTTNNFGMFESIRKPQAQTVEIKKDNSTDSTPAPIKKEISNTTKPKNETNKKIVSFTMPEDVEQLIMAGSMVYKLKGNKSAYITNLIKQDYENKKKEYDLFLTMM